jgi:hypothetical protein
MLRNGKFIYVRTYVCMYVCVCVCVCVFVCMYVCMCVYVRMYVCMFLSMHVAIYLLIYLFTCGLLRRYLNTWHPVLEYWIVNWKEYKEKRSCLIGGASQEFAWRDPRMHNKP